MAEAKILEGAEEFSFDGGPIGAVLIHGFTGSPQGLRGLGEYLAERDIAVEGIRLPGHGTTWEDLAIRRPHEWVAAVEAGYEKVAAGREKVFVVGLSFGVALAVDFLARNPEAGAGLVSLAGFVQTRDPRRFLAPVLRRMVKTLPGVGNDIADPDMREIVYDRIPTSATYFMLQFCKGACTCMDAIRCPVLVVHSHNDHTALPFNAEFIYNTVSSEDKELVWVDASHHVITLDVDRQEVFERTYDFIKQHS
ncbi:MAG: alpha/beta hydrolase [Actinomycetota bacterium]